MEITVYDDCGNALVDGNSVTNYYAGTDAIFNKVITINSPTYTTGNMDVYFPRIGKYKIRKVLRLNQAALTAATLNFKSNIPESCVPSLTTTTTQYTSNLDNSGCQDCSQSQNPSSLNSGDGSFAGSSQSSTISSSYCDVDMSQRKGGTKDCGTIMNNLKKDMSPGGQYFDNIKADADVSSEPTNDWLNVYVPTTVLPFTLNGITATTWDDVRANWDDSWADQLVTYHPEYCQYTACTTTVASSNFSNSMYSWTSTQIANGQGDGGCFVNNGTTLSLSNDNFLSIISSLGSSASEQTLVAYLQSGDNPTDGRCLYEECKYTNVSDNST